jgi:hypothetical protein
MASRRWKPVQILAQVIEVGDTRRKLKGFWDSAAQLSMVTHAKVAECSLMMGKVPPLEVTAYNGRMTPVDALTLPSSANHHLSRKLRPLPVSVLFAISISFLCFTTWNESDFNMKSCALSLF